MARKCTTVGPRVRRHCTLNLVHGISWKNRVAGEKVMYDGRILRRDEALCGFCLLLFGRRVYAS